MKEKAKISWRGKNYLVDKAPLVGRKRGSERNKFVRGGILEKGKKRKSALKSRVISTKGQNKKQTRGISGLGGKGSI